MAQLPGRACVCVCACVRACVRWLGGRPAGAGLEAAPAGIALVRVDIMRYTMHTYITIASALDQLAATRTRGQLPPATRR